jgi:transcriptional regulator with XRE-family HTH domain
MVTMEREGEPEHGGLYLRQLRERAGMTQGEVADRAGVDVGWLAEVEEHGTEGLVYSEIVAVVRATQPPRPEWWDEGHEHDLLVGPDGYAPPRSEAERRYWQRIETVRSAIRRHYSDGRAVSA